MQDSEQFLHSRPILAYQLDATHLQNVLGRLSKAQDTINQEAQGNRERHRNYDRNMQDLADRITRIEGALQNLGGAEDVRNLKSQLADVVDAVDGINQRAIPDLNRKITDSQSQVDRAAAKAVQQAMAPLEQRSQEVLDQTRSEMGKAVQEQQKLSQSLAKDRQALEDQFKSRGLGQQQQLMDQVRELRERVDNVEHNIALPLRDAVQEMQVTTNENWKQIEITTQNFDNSINKLKAEMANLRSDLNSFENTVTNNVAKMKEDLDTKFQMLVQMMQSFERNNQMFEQAVAEAGARLNHARQQATAGGLQQFNSSTGSGPTPVSSARR